LSELRVVTVGLVKRLLELKPIFYIHAIIIYTLEDVCIVGTESEFKRKLANGKQIFIFNVVVLLFKKERMRKEQERLQK